MNQALFNQSMAMMSPEDSFIYSQMSILQKGNDNDRLSSLEEIKGVLSTSSGMNGITQLPLLLTELQKIIQTAKIKVAVLNEAIACLANLFDLNNISSAQISKETLQVLLIDGINSESPTVVNNVIQIANFVKDTNPVLLTKNNWFYRLIQLLNSTTTTAIRKKIQDICYIITSLVNNYADYKEFIYPGLPFIEINMKNINQSASELRELLRILLVIGNNMNKYYKLESITEKDAFVQTFLDNNIIGDLFEILSNIAYEATIKSFIESPRAQIDNLIIKIAEILCLFCEISDVCVNYLLHVNIVEILHELLSDNSTILFLDKSILSLLKNLFPSSNTINNTSNKFKSSTKLLAEENASQYDTFLLDILDLIYDYQELTGCSPQILNEIVSLLYVFIQNTSIEDRKEYIELPFLTSQLIPLIIQERYYIALLNVIKLMELLIESQGETFITIILREGIIEQLKTMEYTTIQSTPQIIIPLGMNMMLQKSDPNEITQEKMNEIKKKVDIFLSTNQKTFENNTESKSIMSKIINLKDKLIQSKNNEKLILETLDVLLTDDSSTQYEIEQSQIISTLCDYLAPNYNALLKSYNEKNKYNTFPCIVNEEIYHKTKSIIEYFMVDHNKLNKFFDMIHIQLNKISNKFPLIDEQIDMIQPRKPKMIILQYNKKIYEDIEPDELENLGDLANDLLRYHLNFSLIESYCFEMNENDIMSSIIEKIFKHSHVNTSTFDPESFLIPKINLYYDNSDKAEEYSIEKKTTLRQGLRGILLKQNKNIDPFKDLWNEDVKLCFGLQYEVKDEDSINTQYYLKTVSNESILCLHSINKHLLYPLNNIKDVDKLSESLFDQSYYFNCIYNHLLYSIKEASPSLLLLSMIINGIKCFCNNKDKMIVILPMIECNSISSMIYKQIIKAEVGLANKIPRWMKDLTYTMNSLIDFDTRLILFKLTFHKNRIYDQFQALIESGISYSLYTISLPFIGSKHKNIFMAERSKEIEAVKHMMDNPNRSLAYFDIQFKDEIGIGQGPTLEFYSSLFTYWQSQKDLWMITSNGSIFPLPMIEHKQHFKDIGFIIAKSIMDGKLINFPLSRLFFDIILNHVITIDKLSDINEDIRKVITEFIRLTKAKKELLSSQPEGNKSLCDTLKYENKTNIEDLCINYILPGHPTIELKSHGNETIVTIDNIEEYIILLYHTLFKGEAINTLKNSFQEGFDMVFDHHTLNTFTTKELEEVICGSLEEKWDYNTLQSHIIPDHGYNQTSSVYQHLLTFLLSLSKEDKKKFLQFSTGCSRLPLGGFASLSPKLTVVKRVTEHHDNPDSYLPSVMTCQNYLKLPDYSSYDILSSKLFTAMNEGGQEFHLS